MILKILRDYLGYDVKVRGVFIQLVMNITDIDDKIINNSIREGIEFYEFAKKWEREFFEDMKYKFEDM